MRVLSLTALSLALSGCAFVPGGAHEDRIKDYDADGDGFVRAGIGGISADDIGTVDCDDDNADVNPAATESCDGIDNDCDGTTDAGVSQAEGEDQFLDADGDGFGDPTQLTVACPGAEGYVANSDDCDDSSAAVNPDASETCNGADDNCDNVVDEGVQIDLWRDTDSDGFGDSTDDSELGCAPTDTLSDNNEDCDDTRADVNPDADEICNEGVDDDCSGAADDDDLAIDKTTWYADDDGDGFGKTGGLSTDRCVQPANTAAVDGDCNDNDPAVSPDATEVCDGIDNNCDDATDEDLLEDLWPDLDGDGYGDENATATAQCPGAQLANQGGDCKDANTGEGLNAANVFPGQVEKCDGFDNNCDGIIDTDAVVLGTWYADADGDGYGVSTDTLEVCDQPDGYASTDGDCDDNTPTVNPDADELCATAGVDDDCDGDTDEADAVDVSTWYADTDDDTFGDPSASLDACVQPSDYVANKTDCDDTRAESNPNAPETCNDIDDDCDKETDEEPSDGVEYYTDGDTDTFGDPGTRVVTCPDDQPTGTVTDKTDCDDGNGAINPDADELCSTDGVDDDCDDEIDEDSASDATTWYRDDDDDAFGLTSDKLTQCDQPDGYVSTDGDCIDDNPNVNPSEPEVCDRLDTDCSGSMFEVIVPTNKATIQTALDDATDDDLICVEAGTYNEDIDFKGKSVVLESFDGAAATVIDGTGGGSVVTIVNSDDATVFDGFTVTGGNRDFGAGVFVSGGGPVLQNLVIRGNTYANNNAAACGGTGAYFTNSAALFRSSVVENNSTTCNTVSGTGILLKAGTTALNNVRIQANTATGRAGTTISGTNYVNGAALAIDSCNSDHTNLILADNTAVAFGSNAIVNASTIYVSGATATISNASVHRNESDPQGLNNSRTFGTTFVDQFATLTLVNVDHSENRQNGDNSSRAVIYNENNLNISYSNFYFNAGGTNGPGGPEAANEGSGLVELEPRYTSTSGNASGWNFQLRSNSQLKDAGDPNIKDADNSRSDIGAYGGPGGGDW